MKSKSYHYRGIDRDGLRITGIITADNAVAAMQELVAKEIVVGKIYRQWILGKSSRIKTKNQQDFIRQLYTLLHAGIPILTALHIIVQSSHQLAVIKLVKSIHNELEAGNSISIAFKKQQLFNDLICNLIYVGEQSGTLDSMLAKIIIHQEKVSSLKRKINKALLYPSTVLLVAIAVMGIMLGLVIPQLANLYHGFGAELPLYTQFILCLAAWFRNYSLLVALVVMALGVFGYIIYQQNEKFSAWIDKSQYKIPVLGNLMIMAVMASFTSTLAITFKAGIALSESLKIVAETINSKLYRNVLVQVQQRLSSGHSLTTSMKSAAVFPKRMLEMIAIGEESGSLDVMLANLAEYYENEVDYLVANLSNALEPMMMIVLGVLVGGLIIGMYLPIFRIGTIM